MNLKLIFIAYLLFFANVIYSQTASFSVDSPDMKYCVGDTVTFSNNSVDYTYSVWNFGDTFETYTENPKHVYLNTATYKVVLTVFNDSGTSDSDSIFITVQDIPQLNLTPADDTTLIFGNSLTISANGDFDSILWSTGEKTTNITVTLSGEYSCFVYNNSNSCVNRDTINVNFVENTEFTDFSSLVMNNVITPNNDGVNDYFFLNDIENINNICELYVYNKRGVLVFSDNNYKNNWNGTTKSGALLQTGTYYIVIKIENKQGITGFVDIIR